MNLQRVLLASGSLVIISLVIIVVIQYKKMEYFMVIQEKQKVLGKSLPAINKVLDNAKCEERCKANPKCKAATIKSNGRCTLKSTIRDTIIDERYASIRYPCELYSGTNFEGRGIYLDVGEYDNTDLEKKGVRNGELRSFKLIRGYFVVLYDQPGFSGNRISFNTSKTDLNTILRDTNMDPPLTWINAIRSIKIVKPTRPQPMLVPTP